MIYLFPTFPMRSPDFDPSRLPALDGLLAHYTQRAATVAGQEASAPMPGDDVAAAQAATTRAQFACIAENVALAHWFARQLGPCDVACAYSMGFFSAATYCDALDFEPALALAREICTLAHATVGRHAWATGAIVGLPSPRVHQLVGAAGGVLEVTDQYGAATVLFTGERDPVKQVLDAALAEGAVATRLIPITAPFHTRALLQLQPLIATVLERVPLRAPTRPILSSTTQELLTTADHIREEFARNICCPMDWQATMHRLLALDAGPVVEAGASTALTELLRMEMPPGRSVHDWRSLEGAMQ